MGCGCWSGDSGALLRPLKHLSSPPIKLEDVQSVILLQGAPTWALVQGGWHRRPCIPCMVAAWTPVWARCYCSNSHTLIQSTAPRRGGSSACGCRQLMIEPAAYHGMYKYVPPPTCIAACTRVQHAAATASRAACRAALPTTDIKLGAVPAAAMTKRSLKTGSHIGLRCYIPCRALPFAAARCHTHQWCAWRCEGL